MAYFQKIIIKINQRNILLVINIILMILSFSIVLLFIILRNEKAIVVKFGDSIRREYMRSGRKEMIKSLKRLDSEPKVGINNTTALLDDWSDIQIGDRLFPLKRRLFIHLLQTLHAQNRFVELEHRSRDWIELNERDVTVRAFYAEAKYQASGKGEKGQKLLSREFARFPLNPELSRFYAKSLIDKGDLRQLEAAVTMIKRAELDRFESSTWKVFWDTGNNFNAKEAENQTLKNANGHWQVTARIPSNTINFRIDTPPYANLRISKISASWGGQTRTFEIKNIKSNHMTPIGQRLETRGKPDPYFYFTVRPLLVHSKNQTDIITVKMDIELLLPTWVMKEKTRVMILQ